MFVAFYVCSVNLVNGIFTSAAGGAAALLQGDFLAFVSQTRIKK